MCQATIRIASRSLEGVTNAELLLNVKDDIALFIQTMEVSFFGRPTLVAAPNHTHRPGAIPPLW